MSFLLCLAKLRRKFGTAQDSARDLAEHFGVWIKRGVEKNLLCVFHSLSISSDRPPGATGPHVVKNLREKRQ
eukprot:s2675_g7.t1